MKVEYNNIIINSENIEKYKQYNFLIGAKYNSRYDAFGNENPDNKKIILYNYSIDKKLTLPSNSKLRNLVDKTNKEQQISLRHELQHAHNDSFGFRFTLIDRICYTYLALYFLDELSAYMAANLYRIANDTKCQETYNYLKSIGMDAQDMALFLAVGILDNSEMCYEYSINAANSFITCMHAMLVKGQQKQVQNIIKKQIPLHKNYARHQDLYTKNFYDIANKYFIFDGVKIKDKLHKMTETTLRRKWENLSTLLFDISQETLEYCCQNFL